MTRKSDDDHKAKDLLEWLGLTNHPDFAKARTLGGIFGVALTLIFAMAVLAAVSVLFGTIRDVFAATPAGPNLGAGALITALLGAPFLIWATVIKHRALGFQKEGHLTDRISKAVEQLGAEKTVKRDGVESSQPNIEVRIGGILSLERIAQDSVAYDKGRDHVRCMEILCAYIRENAPAREAKDHPFGDWEPLADDATEEMRAEYLAKRNLRLGGNAAQGQVRQWAQGLAEPRADIALALRVIGRRDADQRLVEARWGKDAKPDAKWVFDEACPALPKATEEARSAQKLNDYLAKLSNWKEKIEAYRGYRLDLRKTNLQATDLSDLVLSGATLVGARIEGALLVGARIEGAVLWQARMEGATLWHARMEGADLWKARMEGANLYKARMGGAELAGAFLDGAALYSADHSFVAISAEQANSCFGDASVILPEGVPRPAHWPDFELDWIKFHDEWRKWQASPDTYRPPSP